MTDLLKELGFTGPAIYIITLLLSGVIYFVIQWKKDLDNKLSVLELGTEKLAGKAIEAEKRDVVRRSEMLEEIANRLDKAKADYDIGLKALLEERRLGMDSTLEEINKTVGSVAGDTRKNSETINDVEKKVLDIHHSFSNQITALSTKHKSGGLTKDEFSRIKESIENITAMKIDNVASKVKISQEELDGIIEKSALKTKQMIKEGTGVNIKLDQLKTSSELNKVSIGNMKQDLKGKDKKLLALVRELTVHNKNKLCKQDNVVKKIRTDLKDHDERISMLEEDMQKIIMQRESKIIVKD